MKFMIQKKKSQKSFSHGKKDGEMPIGYTVCISLRVDSVHMEFQSALTQLMGSLTPRRFSMQKMNEAKAGIQKHL